MELSAELTASYQCVLRFFHSICVKRCACHGKIDARLHLSRKIIWANLKIWCSKMQPLSTNQRPDLLTSLMNMSLVLTSKSDPKMVCFVCFYFDMCFAPQRRALFRHLNFQKWSGHELLCTFWLGNVLRATTTCNFSSLISPDGSAPAALASLLFDLPEPQIIRKTPRLSYLFTHLHLLPSDSFSSLIFSLLFSSLTLPTSAVSSVHTVGSLTSKLPSATLQMKTLVLTHPIRLTPGWTPHSILSWPNGKPGNSCMSTPRTAQCTCREHIVFPPHPSHRLLIALTFTERWHCPNLPLHQLQSALDVCEYCLDISDVEVLPSSVWESPRVGLIEAGSSAIKIKNGSYA